MDPDINNITLNEYLMYERNQNMARSYPSRKNVAPLRKRIWVYPDSDDEDEEYYSLPPLLLYFQTPQPCSTIKSVHHNSHSEVDTKNMTLEEYARYKLAMSTMKSKIQVPTHGLTFQFFNQIQHTPNPHSDKKDSGLEKIRGDLFRIGAENINVEHEVPNRCDDITGYKDRDQQDGEFPGLPTFFATGEFASVYKQVEENISIAEEKEEALMEDVDMDENQDIDHTGTKEALQSNLARDPFLAYMEFNDHSNVVQLITPSSISNKVEVCGVMLGRNLATKNHFKTGLVGYHVDDDDGMICNDRCCSRKQTWSMA
nr:hypothetical protein [Tanacetum cinerariifolium]